MVVAAPVWGLQYLEQRETYIKARIIQAEVAELYQPDAGVGLAVKSAHQPLEVWRRVRGFIVDNNEGVA